MKKLLYYLSAFILLTAYGCKKEDENPCGGEVCKNGSTCINGACDCPPNYIGSDCGQQVTPKQISIYKIEVKQWPAKTPDGNFWDEGWCYGNLPDLYVSLTDGNGKLGETASVRECQLDSTYTYTDSLPMISTNISSNLILTLYDKDTGACVPSDSMGTVQTQLYGPDNDFPSTLKLADPAKQIETTVYIEYTF